MGSALCCNGLAITRVASYGLQTGRKLHTAFCDLFQKATPQSLLPTTMKLYLTKSPQTNNQKEPHKHTNKQSKNGVFSNKTEHLKWKLVSSPFSFLSFLMTSPSLLSLHSSAPVSSFGPCCKSQAILYLPSLWDVPD